MILQRQNRPYFSLYQLDSRTSLNKKTMLMFEQVVICFSGSFFLHITISPKYLFINVTDIKHINQCLTHR